MEEGVTGACRDGSFKVHFGEQDICKLVNKTVLASGTATGETRFVVLVL